MYLAFNAFKKGNTLEVILTGLVGIFLLYGIIKNLNNSATPIIERQKIKEVKLKRAIKGLTRSRFEVFFENEHGKIKKRLIMLPSSLSDGQRETEKAIRIMIEEKLLK